MHFFRLDFFFFLPSDIPRSGISGSYSSSIFSFLRSLHTVFHSSCTNLPSRQQCPRLLSCPHPHQHSPLLLFLMVAIPTGWGRPSVVLGGTFLVTSDIRVFSFATCPSPLVFWESVYSALLPIFKSGFFFFFYVAWAVYILALNPLLVISFANIFTRLPFGFVDDFPLLRKSSAPLF